MPKQLIFKIKERLGDIIFQVEEKFPKRAYLSAHKSDIRRVVKVLFEDFGARFLTATGIDNGKNFEILYHFSFDAFNNIISVRTFIEKGLSFIDSLVGVVGPSLDWAERELHEILGVDFSGHPDLKRLFSSDEQKGPSIFKLRLDGEDIIGADIDIGYNHRGIESISEEKSYDQITYLAQRICGNSSVSHAMAYANAVEDVLGIEPLERAIYIRTIMAEAERANSHLLWLRLMMHLAGCEIISAKVWLQREGILDMFQSITGSRGHFEMVKPGGVKQDIKEEDQEIISRCVLRLAAGINVLKKEILDSRLIHSRFKGIGILKREDAVNYGAVGPVARASGVSMDTRKDNPYAAYNKIKWEMIVEDEGDVFARVKVRFLEILESISIIQQCLKKMPRGLIDVKIKCVPQGEGIGLAEAPDGESFHYVRSDGTNSPIRHKIRSASYMNIPAVPAALAANSVSDAGIILASMDPCCSCAER